MLKNMKLGLKQGIGFGIIILLAAILGVVGWTSLSNVDNTVKIADDQNRLIKSVLQIRREEKNYLLTKDSKAAETVLEILDKMKTHIDNTDGTLEEEKGLPGMIADYKKAFEEYADLSRQQEAQEKIMVEAARKFMKGSAQLRADAKNVVQSSKNFDELRRNVKVGDDQNRLIRYVLQIRREEKNYLITKDSKAAEAVLEILDKIKTQIDNTDGTLEEDLGLDKMVADYKKAFEEYTDLSLHQEAQEKIMVEAARKFIIGSEELRQETKTAMNSTIGASKTLMIVLTIICIAIGVFLAFYITRIIIVPVTKGVAFAEKMSKGDFTGKLDIDQKDEIGVLANALNDMVSNLDQMFKDITTGVETLSSSSTELSAISQQMTSGSEQTSGKANAVATAAEEMSSNMTSVAAATEEASTNVGMVATAAEEMTAVINEIAQNTEKAQVVTGEAVSEAKSASDKVDELGKAAHDIGKVTETITEISEQTNLLALNATIEAARAGEAGKGFAVVANEIKELAKQTSEATNEIKNKITGIQDSTQGTVTQIEQISKVVNDVNEIVSTISTAVEEQSVTTKEIANNVVQASQGISEVTENVAQSSTVAGEIAKDITEVNQSASEMSNSSSQVNMSAEELSKLAGQLKEMVGRFRI